MHVCVVGIGAMGGGMARCLLEKGVQVNAFDAAPKLLDDFYNEESIKGKPKPENLQEAVQGADLVVVVLQNEPQCQQVCFDCEGNLLSQKPKAVMICSTVTTTWIVKAAERFEAKGVLFIDCPISGGPVRARQGELTMMCSGSEAAIAFAKPALDIMGKEVHMIAGGPGMGQTVKMVHQLLAGVHIVAAAEALSLAAKAGVDVRQMYEIVNGAAGASWMFKDRGQRMLSEDPEVKSQMQIFVKDLDIVYSEAKRLGAPTPVAVSALQQFISAMGLGLAREDDSQVVKVYESFTKTSVARPSKEGTQVGDYFKMEDGTLEEILEVGDEPRHKVVLSNEYVRAIRVTFPPNDTTVAHRHAEDSLYFFLVQGGLDVVNHVQGNAPACDCMTFGEVRFGTHKTDKPLVHKITNKTDTMMLCIDAEVLKSPPVTSPIELVADKHECIKVRDKCRVYKLTLAPGQSVTVGYLFFHLTVVLEPGKVERTIGRLSWNEESKRGDVAWKEPIPEITITNTGETTFVQFIAEWR